MSSPTLNIGETCLYFRSGERHRAEAGFVIQSNGKGIIGIRTFSPSGLNGNYHACVRHDSAEPPTDIEKDELANWHKARVKYGTWDFVVPATQPNPVEENREKLAASAAAREEAKEEQRDLTNNEWWTSEAERQVLELHLDPELNMSDIAESIGWKRAQRFRVAAILKKNGLHPEQLEAAKKREGAPEPV